MSLPVISAPTWIFLLLVTNLCIADEAAWLAKYLPPKYEGGIPLTIKKVEVSRNHVDQELIRAEFTRTPKIVRVLPKEVKLVILPVGAGASKLGLMQDLPFTEAELERMYREYDVDGSDPSGPRRGLSH